MESSASSKGLPGNAYSVFLAEISQDLIELTNIEETMNALGEKIGKYFGVKQCMFAEHTDESATSIAAYGWNAEGSPDLRGTYPTREYLSDELITALRTGESFSVSDTQRDPSVNGKNYGALGIRSFIIVPLVRMGEWRFQIFIIDDKPREWHEDEVELLRELTTRIWTRLKRVRADEELRAADERFRNMADNVPVLIWETDKTGAIYVNQHYLDFFGVDFNGVREMNWADLLHPDDAAGYLAAYQAAVAGREAYSYEARFLRVDGEYRWLVNTGRPFGKDRFVGFSADISDRKQGEIALRESEEKYRTLFESIDEGFCTIEVMFDKHGKPFNWRFLDANPAFDGQTGMNDAIGKTIFDFAPNIEQFWLDLYGEIAVTGEPKRIQHEARELDRFFDVYAFRIGEPGENRVAVIFNDITEKRHSEKIARDREILRGLVGTQERERKRIARDLHDELGQLLTGLRLKLETIRKMCSDEEGLDKIVDEAQEIAKRVDDGVDFLAWELRPAALDDLGLHSALSKFVKEWSRYSGVNAELLVSGSKKIRLEPDVETHLYRIAQEALNNVHKHAKAKHVEVSLERRGDLVVLIVSDDGKGFDPEKKKKNGNSDGIGLIGMCERAEIIGGDIEVESARGKGTTIYVRVPCPEKKKKGSKNG